MNIVELKVVFAIAVFITGVFGVFIPWMIGGGRSHNRFMAWGDTFAGGVLGGAGLIHLLSGADKGFHQLGVTYPLAFLLAGAGFLLILLIEAVIAADSDPGQSPLHCGFRSASHEIGSRTQVSQWYNYSFILLLVLSVHSIILGLALGAQRSLASAMAVFIAIIAHKAMAGFALGVSFRRTESSLWRTAPFGVFFSSITPLGILAGTLIDTLISSSGGLVFESIFNSIGAGTFLYIATLEIIRTEFELPGDNWQKWLLSAVGFGLMAILAVWI